MARRQAIEGQKFKLMGVDGPRRHLSAKMVSSNITNEGAKHEI
jgi:hypothetical protein